jgi:glycyl-tRNA synthetase beta chain
MPPNLPLLLEVGTEELPSSFVDAGLAALPRIVADELAQARLSHGDVRAHGTPRRLAVVVRDVATRQLDLDEEVIGPPETVAFKEGRPTKAAEAFAAKLGVAIAQLSVAEKSAGPKQKAGRYVIGRRIEPGQPAMALLGGALERVCAAVPFKKSMRWGSLDVTFGRPVQWIVALLGEDIVPLSFAGTRSGRSSRGHRFLASPPFDVDRPGTYVEQLRARHVLVDRSERVQTMLARLDAAARAVGGSFDQEPALIDENASLVEEPHVVTGSFESAFLTLPAAVIRAVARGHQKYFCVQKGDDELLPHYLAVVNTANRPDLIAKGTDRAMRARLADARFFWDEDRKTPLESRYEKLGGIVFHHRLGSVREKVERIERLAALIGDTLKVDGDRKAQIARAARLCKCDLVTLMVGEFPELQGIIGRAYAIAQNEAPTVADAIRNHYKPVGAQDDVAPDDVSAAIALADRFDTLTGCFAIGLAPSGAADPFALRRACIAVLRTLLDRGYASVSFGDMVAASYDGFAGKKLDLSKIETVARLEDFATERLRGLLASATSGPVAEAVLGGSGPAALRTVVAALARARALQAVVDANEPWLDKAKIVAKRLAGISREALPTLHGASEFAGSAKRDDVFIQKLVHDLDEIAAGLTSEEAMRSALVAMGQFAVLLDRVFVETLVNDPSDALTPVRLETLAHGAQSMLKIADFSKLT